MHGSGTTLAIRLPDDVRIVRRTTTQNVRNIKAAAQPREGDLVDL
ncbi:hypothetical protein ABZ297_20820 [Nonomuraea sp. NPDC005983]